MNPQDELIQAIRTGDADRVSQLINQDPGLAGAHDSLGISVVLLAAYYQEPQIAALLASRRDELDIFEACAVGSLEQLRRIAQNEQNSINDYSPDGFQPLGLACFFGHTETVAYLLGMGALVNSPSRNPMRVMPLHSAVARQSLAITRMLLAAGADVNAVQADDFTPLHAAAQNGQLEMVRLLVEYGADPEMVNRDGMNAMQIAEKYLHSEVASYLRFSEN